MKNILWLASWYPNRYEGTNGNFVHRHAKAASLYANIHVLHILPVTAKLNEPVEEVFKQDGNLAEQIIYYSAASNRLEDKETRGAYYKLSKKYIRQYISKNGVPDYVHVQVPMPAGPLALWMKKNYGVNYALTEQQNIYNSYAVHPFKKKSAYYKRTTKNVIEGAQPFICVSRQMADEISAIGIKMKPVIISNVVDTDFFRFKAREENNKRFRFLHVSNMTPVKNAEGIIDAAVLLAEKRKDFELRIVGNYPEPVYQKAVQSGLLDKQLFFAGRMPYQQVAAEMQQADAFILFSYSESGSCILEEALCSGLPVISTSVGNSERVNESNGLIVKQGDIYSLAEGMSAIIDKAATFNRKEIAAFFVKQLSYEVIGRQIADGYNY